MRSLLVIGVDGKCRCFRGGACDYVAVEQFVMDTEGLPGGSFRLGARGEGVVRVALRLRGGKGGFGAQLRSQKRKKKRVIDNSACVDLSGRRIGDIKREEELRKWVREEEVRKRRAAAEKRLEEEKERELIRDRAAMLEREQEKMVSGVLAAFRYGLAENPEILEFGKNLD